MGSTLRCLAAVLALASAGVSANEKAEPDPDKSPYWPTIRTLLFGDRTLNPDDRPVLAVYLNTRADDASTVPVMVNALIDQAPQEYIKTVYLIVERNPSPTAGIFHFTPESGRVKVETRLRFEDYSFVRAVAEMNDGRLYMAQRWVKAAGGCSAPMGKNAVPAALLGKMRFRGDDTFRLNRPNLIQVQIRHPNESPLAADFDPGKTPQFVRGVNVTYNGMPVMSAQVDFSLSDNPVFRFYFLPREEGRLRVQVEDTHDRVYEQELRVTEGAELPGG
ncbi:MAG TPA: quinoprotein dehydrogenase-associated SoxYZ-like carrier [Burkholderiales bacterium]|jgi:sulfur-oxidizing protein SoxY|nr:quinoprotein dehydrogenase-associated SoxYZ-like carrier [Burkholderiales bacterium]